MATFSDYILDFVFIWSEVFVVWHEHTCSGVIIKAWVSLFGMSQLNGFCCWIVQFNTSVLVCGLGGACLASLTECIMVNRTIHFLIYMCIYTNTQSSQRCKENALVMTVLRFPLVGTLDRNAFPFIFQCCSVFMKGDASGHIS